MKNLVLISCILFMFRIDAGAEPLQNPAPSSFPALIPIVRITDPLDFCGEPVPLNQQNVRERMEKELLLSLWDRPQVVLWIKRSSRYLPLIEKMLAEHGLPDDLKYTAVIESALRPHVGSPKGALGFWQFMRATGRKYGLRITPEIDDRRNVFTSTRGAIAYYKALYAWFGSWTLSAAAFNMGEEGLKSEILAQETDLYYDLYLPLETQRYIFRALSAKLILSQPEKYGFRFTPEDLYPPLQFDRIDLNFSQKTPIRIIARAAKTSFKKIKDLNPEIRGHHMPEGQLSISVPKGAARGFHKRLKKLLGQWEKNRDKSVYVVKTGENLSSIADRFNVPLPALLIWNRLDPTRPIHPGDRLVIPPLRAPSDRNKKR